MPYRNKQMLRDANGDLIPQYWDITAGEFKPLTGQDGAQDTRLTGSIVEDYTLINQQDDIIITAGSQLVLDPIKFKGSEFGFNLRFVAKISNIEIVVQQLSPETGSKMASIWVLLEGSGTTFNAREKLKSGTTQFLIRNKSTEDVTIHTLVITDFL